MKTKQLNAVFNEIETIKEKYDEIRSKDRFNIFYALHKEHDEVNLHSRFISYLLAPNSGHNQKAYFAKKLFIDVLKLNLDESFFKNYEVIPNEFNKSEFEEIDILILNRALKKAIIFENKIYAKDSNHYHKVDNDEIGPLSRYYNVLSKKENEFGYDKENINIIYLTLNKPNKERFKISKGNIPIEVKEVYYAIEIVEWLTNAVKEIEDSFLKKTINQYLILVKNMSKTNFNNNEILELKKVVSQNTETTRYLIDNFKHIKWHTIHQFWTKLHKAIKAEGLCNVELYYDGFKTFEEALTKIAWYNDNLNIGIKVNANTKNGFYVSSLNNLSYGLHNADYDYWSDFSSVNELEAIRFSDFSTENTYKLIDETNTDNAINLLIEQLKKDEKVTFEF